MSVVFPIIRESLLSSLSTILILTAILVPIMIFLEYVIYFNMLEKISSYFSWLTKYLTLPPEAAFPLLIGLFIGVFYGAAVIIEYAKRNILNKRDLLLVGVFLAINHSIIEENLLLTVLGADLIVLIVYRFIMAFLITRATAYYIDRLSIKKQLIRKTYEGN